MNKLTEKDRAIMKDMFARVNEQYEEEGFVRRTGKTFRTVMWALLTASANPGKKVLHMSASRDAARNAFDMAVEITRSVESGVNPHTAIIDLDNGASVKFDHADVLAERFTGHRFHAVAKDLD